jgi:hypothetical protein
MKVLEKRARVIVERSRRTMTDEELHTLLCDLIRETFANQTEDAKAHLAQLIEAAARNQEQIAL